MTITALNPADTTSAPVCEDCDQQLRPVGGGSHPYWACGYCGTVHPR